MVPKFIDLLSCICKAKCMIYVLLDEIYVYIDRYVCKISSISLSLNRAIKINLFMIHMSILEAMNCHCIMYFAQAILQSIYKVAQTIHFISGYKVFRLPKTLFIQVFIFIHPGVCFYCTANSEPVQ